MSPRTFVARGAALLALATLGLAACESKTVVQPAQFPLQISVTPSSLSFTKAGDKATVVASLTGGDVGQAAQGVAWASGNSAVATVDQSGNVTAVANGTTTITATSKALASVVGATSVTVNIPPVVQPPPVAAPTVSIQSITKNDGTQVDVTAAGGQINVALNVDVPTGNTISSVNVLVDGVIQCSQTFSAGNAGVGVESANAVTIVCPINTLKLDASGKPVFTNGPHTITATLVAPGGTIKAQTSQAITFANTSSLGLSVTAAKTANDATGLLWNGGNLTVTVTPTIFGSTQFASFIVNVVAMDTTGTTRTVSQQITTTGTAPATVTFRGDTTQAGLGLQGLEDATAQVQVIGVTTGGNQFTNAGAPFASTLRYDDAAPRINRAGALATVTFAFGTSNWLNGATTFAQTCGTPASGLVDCAANTTSPAVSVTGLQENGVDKVTIQFQTGSASSSSPTFTTDTALAQLPETAAGALVARIRVCDALGNCANSAKSGAFGVDITPPVVSSVVLSDTINGAAPEVVMNLTGDNLSGFPANFVFAQIVKDSASSTGSDIKRCVDPNAGTLSSVPSSGCAYVALTASSSLTIAEATAGNGYYTVNMYAVDLAGNQTAVTNKAFLVDRANANSGTKYIPTVSSISTSLTNNLPAISATLKDNVELAAYQGWQRYAGVIFGGTVTDIPMTAPTTAGAFGLPLTAVVSASATGPFGSLQNGQGGAVTQLASVGFIATDFGDNSNVFANGSASLTTAGGGVSTTDVLAAPNGFTFTASATTLCATGTTAACGATPPPSTVDLSAAVTFTAATTTANPIVKVYFYAVDAVTSQAVLLGSATPTFAVNTSNQRVYTFKLSGLAATALPIQPAGAPVTNTVFAVGVDANNNGVLMGAVAGINLTLD